MGAIDSKPVVETIKLKDLLNQKIIDDDIFIDDIYDYITGSPMNYLNLRYVLDSDKYYFHGTKPCSAMLIIRDGFKLRPSGAHFSGEMLGPGVYVSDNIRKTFSFGNFVFVCKMVPKKQLEVENIGRELQEIMFREEIQNESYDSVLMQGTYDKSNNLNDKKLLQNSSSRFNEVAVKKLNDLRIEFVMHLKRTEYNIIPPRIVCKINMQTSEFQRYQYDNSETISKEIGQKYWYLICDLGFLLEYSRSVQHDYIDRNKNKTTIYNSLDRVLVSFYTPAFRDVIKQFILEIEMYRHDGSVIIPITHNMLPHLEYKNVNIKVFHVYYISDDKSDF